MSLKNETLKKSCSADLTAATNSKNSITGSLKNMSCKRQSTGVIDSITQMREQNMKSMNLKFNLTANTSRFQRLSVKDKKQNESVFFNSCNCFNCVNPDDVPKDYLDDLKHKLEESKKELSREKNFNQLLRRNFFVASKVVRTEIGVVGTDDLNSLLEKASEESWKGRQEIILALKRKMRELNEIIEQMDGDSTIVPFRTKTKVKSDDCSDVITDDRLLFWCLELERREVWKNAERYKLKIVANRDCMKNRLESLICRNEELVKEACFLRNRLSTFPKQIKGGLIQQLQDLEKELKHHLEEKADLRQLFEDMEEQNCRSFKLIADMKAKLASEKEALKEKEAMVRTMKENEVKLLMDSDDVKNDLRKQSATIKKKLDEVEQDYGKTFAKVEQLDKLFKNCKFELENLRQQWAAKSISCIMREIFPSLAKRSDSGLNNKNYLCTTESEPSVVESPENDIVQFYERKLQKYQSMFHSINFRNKDKLKHFHDITDETKEEMLTYFKNRCCLEKLSVDTNVLKCRVKKYQKTLFYPPVKCNSAKKVSTHQLVEVLDEKKRSLAIRKVEKKFLKSLTMSLLEREEDDCDLLESFLTKNKDMFLRKTKIQNKNISA